MTSKFDNLASMLMEMFSFTDEIDKHARHIVRIYGKIKRKDEPLGSIAKLDRAIQIWASMIERDIGEEVPMAAVLDVREAARHLLNQKN